MPEYNMPINGWNTTVARPTVYKIVEDLNKLKLLPRLPKKHVKITTEINKTTTDQSKGEGYMPYNRGDELLYISYNLKRRQTRAHSRSTRFLGGMTPIFNDKQGNVRIFPNEESFELMIKFDYYTPNHNEIQDYITRLMGDFQDSGTHKLHDNFISYGIPENVHEFLKETLYHRNQYEFLRYNLRQKEIEAQKLLQPGDDGYTDYTPADDTPFKPLDYADYLSGYFMGELEMRQDKSATFREFIFTMYQHNIQGMFIDEAINLETYEDEMYHVELNYKVYISLPTKLRVSYNTNTYNSTYTDKWLPVGPKRMLDGREIVDSRVQTLVEDRISKDREYNTFVHDRINIPDWDYEAPYTAPVGYVQVMSVLYTVDLEDRKAVFNLNDIDGSWIDKHILDWIREEEWEYMIKPYTSIFNLTYLANTAHSHQCLRIDDQATITCEFEQGPLNTNRMGLNVAIDLKYIPLAALVRAAKRDLVLATLVSVWVNVEYITEETGEWIKEGGVELIASGLWPIIEGTRNGINGWWDLAFTVYNTVHRNESPRDVLAKLRRGG